MDINKELLDPDSDSQAVEADEELTYTPDPDKSSGVVAIEPDIITLGRKMRKDAVRTLPPEQQ